jgi:histidinol-phosphatase
MQKSIPMIKQSPEQWLTFLQICADEADDLSRHYFNKAHLKIEQKSNDTPVTEADLAIEKKIREIAAQKHPDLPIYAEEFGQCPDDAPLKLIIDPIDGTRNFVYGIPFVGTLLAIEENGEIVAGVVSSAPSDDRWWAAKNHGSFYQRTSKKDNPIKKLQVTTVSQLSEAQMFHSSPFGSEAKGSNPETFVKLLSATKRQRGFGDFYAPMFVAQGSGEFSIDYNLKPWDMAPIKIIIEEAGGTFTDLNGIPSIYNGTFLASNTVIHQTVLDMLKY